MRSMKPLDRMFLQGLMSKHSGMETEILELLKLCIQKTESEEPANAETLEEVVTVINSHIRPIHMEIKQGIDELIGKRFFALVNTCETSVARLSSNYTVNELEYFKKIVEELVVESKNGEISSIEVLNLVDKLEKKLTKKEAQDLIERFVNDNWLVQAGNGAISLHVRAIIELEHYIKEVFPQSVTICPLCKQLAMRGKNCSNCDIKLHKHCASRLSKNAANATCPECKVQWSSD